MAIIWAAKKKKLIVISVLCVAVIFSIGRYVWRQEHRPHIFEVFIFPVTSGFSMFIRTPEDKRILVDGGSNSDVIRYITSVLPFYSRRIDMLLATDDKATDVSGLIDVVDRYSVTEAFVPGITLVSLGLSTSTDPTYSAFLDELGSHAIPISRFRMGQKLTIDSETFMRILFPAASSTFAYSRASAPFTVLSENAAITFVGNATPKIQKYIASSTSSGSTGHRVLVVSQNAVPANMSAQFVDEIRPDYLVYSKTIRSLSSPSSSKSSKPLADPLQGITMDKRFNTKVGKTIKIASDGTRFEVGYENE